MIEHAQVPLASLTTLRIGGPAARVVYVKDESEVREALKTASAEGLSWYVLGGGSNVLAPDAGYQGMVIVMQLPRTSFDDDEEGVLAIAEAGVPWDDFVREAASRGVWGLENLAGIPGSVGAAPVQNIGAYGTEIADTLLWVDALDPDSGEVVRLERDACELGYRDSRFKRNPGLIILRVAFRLRRDGAAKLSYKDLQKVLHDGVPLATPAEVGNAVRAIRAKKFPDLRVEGTAGSFFKNPVVSEETYGTLAAKHQGLPGFPGKSGVKLSLAWILDNVLGLKGLSVGGARLYEAQPLVIATSQGATAREVNELAEEVAARVKEAVNIDIEREVRTLV